MAANENQDVMPASRYLQERLQERRARHMRPRRVRQSDFGPIRGRDDDIFLAEAEDYRRTSRRFDSSPLTTMSRAGSEAGSAGPSRRRTMGMRDLNEQMDRLTKENFALKLELDHRRDHTTKLQEQIISMTAAFERAERMEEEHAELLRINTQLVEELEKRDKAIEEAMDIICDLEDKIAEFDAQSIHTRPSTAKADSGYAGTETQEQVPPSSPPEIGGEPKTPRHTIKHTSPSASAATSRLLDIIAGETPAKIRREPAVLTQQLPSTHALRSVYMENAKSLHPVQSFASLLTRRDQRAEEEVEISSPRLSVLSESSFRSMYTPDKPVASEERRHEADEALVDAEHSRQDSINRVSRWMDESAAPDETPSKSNRISAPLSQSTLRAHSPQTKPDQKKPHFQSLNDAMATASPAPPSRRPGPDQARDRPLPRSRASANGGSRPPSFAGPIFGDSLLPPTPESVSTRMLRSSQSSILGERSLLDTTPAPVKNFQVLEPGVRTAPRQMRSSVELKSAYATNLQHRNAHRALSSSEGDEDDIDVRSESDRGGLNLNYEGYPDGGSLLCGTPSRFLEHSKAPTANLLFDGNELSPPRHAAMPQARRESSSDATAGLWSARLVRADTSPSLAGNSWHSQNNGSKALREKAASPTFSPRLSANRFAPDNVSSLASSIGNSTSKMSMMSPARHIGQRTQRLFRRLSGGQLEHPRSLEPRSPREKSPLPTLTCTPSSEYARAIPKEIRRPSTAEGSRQSFAPGLAGVKRPPSTRGRRPSLQSRTKTEPPVTRVEGNRSPQPTTPGLEADADYNFHRTRSIQQKAQLPNLAESASPSRAERSSKADGAVSGQRRPASTRRGSFKDAVIGGALRSWR